MATYLEVDMEVVRDNIRIFRKHIERAKLMAVVKGDAYGHGMIKFSKYIEPLVDAFGVGLQSEALELRQGGIKKPILLMSPYFENEMVHLHDITPSIDSIDRLESYESFLQEKKVRRGYHLLLNTGMNRFGLPPKQFKAFCHKQLTCDFARLEGIYSHFANNCVQNPLFVKKQLQLFKDTLKKIKWEHPPFLHMANSEIAIDVKDAHFHMVRIGNGLYGPCYTVKDLGLKKAAKMKSTVIDIRKIEKGNYIGYGATKKSKRDMTVAILELGYRDGYQVSRYRSPEGIGQKVKEMAKILLETGGTVHKVQYRGQELPVVGKVNMQFLMVDVSRYGQIELGTVLDISGSHFFLDRAIERKYINIYDGQEKEEKEQEDIYHQEEIKAAVIGFEEKKRREE